MFEYFYNEILRRTIISFGTLFNGLTIKTTNADDDVVNITRVPLAYGPTQKFLARLEQQADLNKATAMTLPRMSFEFTGLTYDPARKVSTVQQFVVKDPDDESESKKAYMPVPYNMSFELAIMTKLNDDALQIVEQILPYFQPDYTITVNDMPDMGIKRDVPIVLNSIGYEDDYQGIIMLRFQQSKKLPTNEFKKKVLDGLQLAYKVTANSVYGQLGARTSTIFKMNLAACTTAIGRNSTNIKRNLIAHVMPNASGLRNREKNPISRFTAYRIINRVRIVNMYIF